MAFALKASSLTTRLLSSQTPVPHHLPASVSVLRSGFGTHRLAARTQTRTMAADSATDVTLDKNTPDDVWKKVLDAQEVRTRPIAQARTPCVDDCHGRQWSCLLAHVILSASAVLHCSNDEAARMLVVLACIGASSARCGQAPSCAVGPMTDLQQQDHGFARYLSPDADRCCLVCVHSTRSCARRAQSQLAQASTTKPRTTAPTNAPAAARRCTPARPSSTAAAAGAPPCPFVFIDRCTPCRCTAHTHARFPVCDSSD